MAILMRVAGALIFAYFMSRLTLRLPNPYERFKALLFAHLLSLVALAALVAVVRVPANAFAPRQILIFAAAQIAWLFFDRIRRNYPQQSG